LIDLISHSSSKKCVHLSHLHHHLFAFVNKLQLFLNSHHSFSANVHHDHQLLKLRKQSSVVSVLCQFHHDRSSSNDFHPFHPNHVCTLFDLCRSSFGNIRLMLLADTR
jgi:hypothetical protein